MTQKLKTLTLLMLTDKSSEVACQDVADAVKVMQDQTSDGDGTYPTVGEAALTNYEDVQAFHVKFGVPESPLPAFLDVSAQTFRHKFLQEELDEFGEAYAAGDLLKAADALVDLVYVALGTASMMGLPWQPLWAEVQRANMAKVRAEHVSDSKRGSLLDVVKPEGWVAPDHSKVLGEGPWPNFMTLSRELVGDEPASTVGQAVDAEIQHGDLAHRCADGSSDAKEAPKEQ